MVDRILRRPRGGRRRAAGLCLGSLLIRASGYRPHGSSALQGEGPRWGGSPPRQRLPEPVTVPGPKRVWTFGAGALHLSVALVADGSGLAWHAVEWWDESGADAKKCVDKVSLGALFAVKANGRTVSSLDCTADEEAVSSGERRFRVHMYCPKGLRVEFSVDVDKLPSGGAAARIRTRVEGETTVNRVALLLMKADGCSAPTVAGEPMPGMPVIASGGRFVLAAHHPMANNLFSLDRDMARYDIGSGMTSKRHTWVAEVSRIEGGGQDWGAMIVAAPEPKAQIRRAFAEYIEAVRHPRAWQGPMVHYNSWFDFHSWQERGMQNIALLSQLKEDIMDERGVLDRIAGFEELARRGVHLDSFLLDDGWDDPDELWTPDRMHFPRGFSKVSAALQEKLRSGLGIWLSPWGGYGDAQNRRIALAKRQGLETNSGGLSLAGPLYSARFKEAVQRFRCDANVNMFKFDGFAGDKTEMPQEVEAMLSLISEVREACPSSSGRRGFADSRRRRDDDSIWINLTTGTWPSPFFLLWADSIWRGNGDLGAMRSSTPSLLSVTEGLSPRQRWQVWRDCVVHENVVQRAPLFPIGRLMVHGVVLGAHGEALAKDLDKFTKQDWAQEVWSLAAMGLQLQELYISHQLMNEMAWDELAEALKWAKSKWHILEDAHWAIPMLVNTHDDAKEFPPYAVASYHDGEGVLMLRNPRNKVQLAPKFTIASVLELPERMWEKRAAMKTVRSISLRQDSLDKPLNCDTLLGVVGSGRCHLDPRAQVSMRMEPGELLVLSIKMWDRVY